MGGRKRDRRRGNRKLRQNSMANMSEEREMESEESKWENEESERESEDSKMEARRARG